MSLSEKEEAIDSLKNVIDVLDGIIEELKGSKNMRFPDDPHEFTQTEIKNIREFLRRLLEQTVNNYAEQVKREKLEDITPLE